MEFLRLVLSDGLLYMLSLDLVGGDCSRASLFLRLFILWQNFSVESAVATELHLMRKSMVVQHRGEHNL